MKRLFSILVLAVACSSTPTYTTDVYRDPTTAQFHFQRIAAIAIADNADIRHAAEDAMVQRLGAKGVASYTILSPEDEHNAQTVLAKLQSLNIDGAVTMELLSSGEEHTDARGNIPDSYKAFTGYYGASRQTSDAWETVARVETQIFSVTSNKLLWSAATKTFNPENAHQIVNNVADVVAKELRKSKLIE